VVVAGPVVVVVAFAFDESDDPHPAAKRSISAAARTAGKRLRTFRR
jgi:hypothetical protein